MRHPTEERSSPSGSPSAEPGVLIVEDDPAVAEVVATALAARGYDVQVTTTGRAALDAAIADVPDIVLLDLGLPDIDGVTVCRELRRWTTNPILVLSADGAEDRKVAALDEGADDYVTKPFSMPELLARLRVAERHRRLQTSTVVDDTLVVGDLVVDLAARAATVAGASLSLTRKQHDLLVLLARNSGKVMTHGALLEGVWGRRDGGTESLRVHVNQLRHKLGTGPARPVIVTEPGTGYRLSLEDDRQ